MAWPKAAFIYEYVIRYYVFGNACYNTFYYRGDDFFGVPIPQSQLDGQIKTAIDVIGFYWAAQVGDPRIYVRRRIDPAGIGEWEHVNLALSILSGNPVSYPAQLCVTFGRASRLDSRNWMGQVRFSGFYRSTMLSAGIWDSYGPWTTGGGDAPSVFKSGVGEGFPATTHGVFYSKKLHDWEHIKYTKINRELSTQATRRPPAGHHPVFP